MQKISTKNYFKTIQKTPTNDDANRLQIRLAIQCNPEFVGPLCEFKRDLCSLPSAAIGRNNHLLAPTTATPFASSFFSPIQIQRSPSSNLLLNSNFAASVPQQQQLDAAVKPRDSTNQQDSSTFLTSYSSSSSLIKDHSFNKQKTAAAAAENQNKKLLNDELLQQQQKAVVCFSHLPSLKDVPFGCLFNFNTAAASGGGGVGRGEIHNSCQVCRYGHRDGHCVNDLAQWQQLDQKKVVFLLYKFLFFSLQIFDFLSKFQWF
jgi:hypothetical protein